MSLRRSIHFMVCLCFAACPTFSQVTVSVGGGIGSPNVSSRGSSYQFQVGGFYRLFERVDLGLSVAYQTFSGTPSGYAFRIIPVAVEGRLHFSNDGFDPYFLVGLGVAHLEYNYDEVYRAPIDFWKYQTSAMKQFYHDNHVVYALGAGVIVPATSVLSVDLGFRLTVVDSYLELRRVFDPVDPVQYSGAGSWVISQWSVCVLWKL